MLNEGHIGAKVHTIRGGPDLWLFEGTPLSRLLNEARKAIAEPIVGDLSLLSEAFEATKERARHQWVVEFKRDYPTVDYESAWKLIDESKTELAAIAALDTKAKGAFVNLTAWCYSKEATRATPRFSIDRLWRAVGWTREETERHVQRITFDAQCGACGCKALATAGCGPLRNVTRPTFLECPTCGHRDQVGRQSSYNLNAYVRFAPRFNCSCLKCRNVRQETAKFLAENIVQAVDATASELLRESELMALQWHSWSSRALQNRSMRGQTVADLVEDLLGSGLSLFEALSQAAPTQVPGITDAAARAQHFLNEGIEQGWLEVRAVRVPRWDEGGRELGLESVEIDLRKYGPSDSLQKLLDDCGEQSDEALKRVLLRREHHWDSPAMVIDVAFVGVAPTIAAGGGVGGGRLSRNSDPPTAAVHVSSADGKPENEVDPDLEVVATASTHSVDDAKFSEAVLLMRKCIERVDAELGEGTSKREPALVAALMQVAMRT